MAKEKGIAFDVCQSTAGGATLKDHWDSKKGLKSKIVLQDHAFSIIIL